MSPDLIPVPLLSTVNPPKDEDPEHVRSALAELIAQWNKTIPVLRQDIFRLSVPDGPTPRVRPTPVGGAFAVSELTGLPFLLNTSSFKDGLLLADGTDRGKVNVTFNYLGVGPHLIGSGASVTYTADLAVAGANGLDTGTEAANTWYAIHMIVGPASEVVDRTGNNLHAFSRREGSKVAALFSTSSTAPTLPPGFTRFRRVGWARNDGSSNLYQFINSGNWTWWNADVSVGDFLVLNAGSATTFTGVSTSAVVPSTSRRFQFSVKVLNNAAGTQDVGAAVRPTGTSWANGGCNFGSPALATTKSIQGTGVIVETNASQSFDYLVNLSTTQLSVYVQGYYDAV